MNLALVAGALADAPIPVPVTVRVGDADPEHVGDIAVRFEVQVDLDNPGNLIAVCSDGAGIRGQVAALLERAAADLRADEGGDDAASR